MWPMPVRQAPVQPVETLAAQRAIAAAGHHGVERDQAYRVILDRVLHERLPLPQIPMLGEAGAQRRPLVVIAG